jgi:phenylacetate-CoA ligase
MCSLDYSFGRKQRHADNLSHPSIQRGFAANLHAPQRVGVPMRLDDPSLDSTVSQVRDAWLVEAVREQIAFVRAKVPFWRERLSNAAVDERCIESLADFARVPIFTKEELRATRPAALLPNDTRLELKISRWTSGTSGQPTVNFWSETDWAALVASTARMLGRQAPKQAPTAFNAYSQAHVTGPLYSGALRRLGAVVYDRSHHPEELFSTLAQTELFDFDTLILPERTTRGKGFGLVNLLDEDPKFLARRGVLWWIGSSGTFGAETVERVREQGVQVVSNLYGSSEFAVFAISCPKIPGDYHVAQGHVLVEVVDQVGKPVENGQFGRIVVTHLCGMDRNGQARTHGGTQILRLAAGDGATFLSDACSCRLTTPRLRGVQRVGATRIGDSKTR